MKDNYFLTSKAAHSYDTSKPKAFGFRLWSMRRGMSLLATPLILGAIADLPTIPKAIAGALNPTQPPLLSLPHLLREDGGFSENF
ncbi:hypothetical protein [Limnospira platensis]|uniref:hypothetical protein n=1 Tax=Limnospira platensis TaxID=118562 RepID=UPI00396C466B